jgi:hypothetical protein
MKIEVIYPHPAEAKVADDSDSQMTIVEPIFRTAKEVKPVFYMKVIGKQKGDERRFVVSVSGKDGKVTVQEIHPAVEAAFDMPADQRDKVEKDE